MSSNELNPHFLEVGNRSIFVMEFKPCRNQPARGSVLYFPAFAEEMNRSRTMVASQARELSIQGFKVWVPDYFGTGDSGGDFASANWNLWLSDMLYCARLLQNKPHIQTIFWGHRLGALMAIELSAIEALSINQLILWNPVLNGQQYMQQFLRIRLAASIMSGEKKEKLNDLKDRLERDGVLEVAGYELSDKLFTQIIERNAQNLATPKVSRALVVELSSSGQNLTLPTQSLCDKWGAQGIEVDTALLKGPQFWSTQEISSSENLLEYTRDWAYSQVLDESP